MLSDGIAPDAMALHTLLRALSAAGQWPTALAVFDAVVASDDADVCTPTVYAAALTACAIGAQSERAKKYLAQMKAVGLTPSQACYTQGARHCTAPAWRASTTHPHWIP